MTSSLPLNNFYPTIYRRVQKEKENDELLCTVRSLVMVRNQLPAQVTKDTSSTFCHSTSSEFSLTRANNSREYSGVLAYFDRLVPQIAPVEEFGIFRRKISLFLSDNSRPNALDMNASRETFLALSTRCYESALTDENMGERIRVSS